MNRTPLPPTGTSTARRYQAAFAVVAIAASMLACSLFSQVGDQVSSVRETAASIGTQVESGQGLLQTAQSLATEAGSSGVLATLGAVVTQANSTGLLETARAQATQLLPGALSTLEAFATNQGTSLQQTAVAFATEQGPSLQATAIAAATEQGPAIAATLQAAMQQTAPAMLETAQALATQQGPSALQTAQAFATQMASGQPPADIPLIAGERVNYFASPNFVTYQVSLTMAEAVDFYQQEMPRNGWSEGRILAEATGTTLISFEKNGTTCLASFASPGGNAVTITIVVQPK